MTDVNWITKDALMEICWQALGHSLFHADRLSILDNRNPHTCTGQAPSKLESSSWVQEMLKGAHVACAKLLRYFHGFEVHYTYVMIVVDMVLLVETV